MIRLSRLVAITPPVLLGLTFVFPLLELQNPGPGILRVNLIAAISVALLAWLLAPGAGISVLMAVQSLAGWRRRVWGWIGLAGSACLLTGAVGVVTADWPYIMYDHIIDGQLVPSGPVRAEPSWGLLLVLAAAASLALASILQLVAAKRRVQHRS
ncbi:hypothetical protein [Brevibacterium otitidis]|uniref:Uncharacterized protein n=1 Tax=Brevibacterium otitidis TaxID=53364 RepID=A0ABV5X0D4_9MICO|nr:hypothetical protein GCM10023233_06910 [Brevibacterium otitidis]